MFTIPANLLRERDHIKLATKQLLLNRNHLFRQTTQSRILTGSKTARVLIFLIWLNSLQLFLSYCGH